MHSPVITRTRYVSAFYLIVTAAVAASLSACGKGTAPATQPSTSSLTVPITVAKAQTSSLERTVHVVGSLAAIEKVTLSNRITGTVDKIYGDLGAHVKPGERLAEIEPERFQLAVRQAEQSLQESLARLGLKDIPGESFDIDTTAPVSKSLSELNAAQVKYNRTDSLYKQKLINDFEFFDAQAALRVAEATLRTAREDTRAQIAAARTSFTNIAIKNRELLDATIFAPNGTTPTGPLITSYTISERTVSPGQYLREGTALFTLVADRTLKLQARVPERFLSKVKEGQIVSFKVEAYPESFQGKVTALDPTVDPANRTFLVEATVDNANGRLRPGSFVQADIATEKSDVVLVPIDAITSFAGVTKLYAISDAAAKPVKVHQIEVQTGQQKTNMPNRPADETWIEIIGEKVPVDQLVATSGLSKLVEGAIIEIREDPSLATQPAAQTASSEKTTP